MRSDITSAELTPEGPGPQRINALDAIRLQGGRFSPATGPSCPVGNSALCSLDFFRPRLIFLLCPDSLSNTIYGVPGGADLNLLWLGLKMIIFGVSLRVPCGYRGHDREKPLPGPKLG